MSIKDKDFNNQNLNNLNNNSNAASEERNLSEVFKELQEQRAKYINDQIGQADSFNTSNGITTYFSSNKKKNNHNLNHRIKQATIRPKKQHKKMNPVNVTISFSIIAVLISLLLLFISYNFTTYGKEEVIESSIESFESNEKTLDLTQIISSNVNNSKIKETVNEQRVVEFPIKYQANSSLPKGEEAIVQEGVNGNSQVIAVRTYDNNEMVEENIIETTIITEPVQQIVDVGTSEFLAKHSVHIGDIMYVTSAVDLMKSADKKSEVVTQIPSTLDVKLLELSGNWCKISYDEQEGYIEQSNLTSATSAPDMVEKARVQRILRDVKIDMDINKKSGLALSDFKKILSGNTNDTNKIFENNYQVFFNAEQTYNINGVFLASLAIHESAWGTSQIANDKKNLFGYGAYDSDPYNSAFEFEDYSDGVDLVAKSLVKYYVNTAGTKIYDNELAVATYYNGSNLEGVNQRYSTDQDWHKKVFNYMETLYNKLKAN